MIRRRSSASRARVLPPPVQAGATLEGDGARFVLFCRSAERLHLLLFDHPEDPTPAREIELDPATCRQGDVWSLFVPGVRAGMAYVYRTRGTGSSTRAGSWLLDPWAKAIAGRPRWGNPGRLRAGHYPRKGAHFPKGLILDDRYDWEGDRPLHRPLADEVICELHVRGYTAHGSARVEHPGTYRGLIDKIPHLARLGVTAVELLPIHEFDELEYFLENGNRRALRNFWGYSTMGFFAPNGRYAAADPRTGGQLNEFRDLVKALHRADIQVILDVVYNHTCEGDAGGPVVSFKGLDPDLFYLLDPTDQSHRNYSGCGNTVNANHPVVQDFILSSLRWWVQHLHVDGFRFDLASALTRGPDGEPMAHPPLIERISEDPVLRDTCLIAEAWDAAGLYQVGSFPGRRWAEWNGRYRDDVRRFWTGEAGILSAFASRLVGSPDLYDRPGQTPAKSINFITCHDGFTLRDLVSYRHKHNLANGEDNRDGEKHNFSTHHGVEGPTDDPAINAARLARQKCLLGTLFLSQGVPMLLGGDEFGRTQQGNNNAYCQDNELSWVDWDLLREDDHLFRFTRQLLALRAAFPTLRQERFLDDRERDTRPRAIAWRSARGHTPHWAHGRRLGLLIHGDRRASGLAEEVSDLFLIFNANSQSIDFSLPEPACCEWVVELSSEPRKPPISRSRKTVRVAAGSLTVLSAPRDPESS